MSVGRWKVYDIAKKYLQDGTFDLDDSTNWKMALFSDTSNVNDLTLDPPVYGDCTDELANINGYITGGNTLTNVTWTRVGGMITFDVSDSSWTASGGSLIARYAVIYKDTTVNSIVKPLLCICLLDTTPADIVIPSGKPLSITINILGVFTLSGADQD